MKSEERHRLQENEVERVLQRALPVVSTFWQKNQTVIMCVGGAALLGIVAAVVWSSSGDNGEAEPWTDMFRAQNLEILGDPDATRNLENLADSAEFAGSSAVVWAKLRAAQSHLQSGIGFMFTNRKAGTGELTEAKELFQSIVDDSSSPPAARERALFGLATCIEALSGEDTSPAIAAYEQVKLDFPETVYLELIDERIKALKKPSTREFYAWFAKQQPKPGDRAEPADLGPLGGDNELPVFLPEIPDMLKLPDQPLEKPGTAKPFPELESGTETATPTDNKPDPPSPPEDPEPSDGNQ